MAYFKAGSLYFAQNSNVVVDNASGDIANFNTQLCLPLLETKLGFSAKQDLHGYDSPWMDSTVLDKKPYLLQPISGTASRYGNYLYDKIIGGTVAFNQLITYDTSSWKAYDHSTKNYIYDYNMRLNHIYYVHEENYCDNNALPLQYSSIGFWNAASTKYIRFNTTSGRRNNGISTLIKPTTLPADTVESDFTKFNFQYIYTGDGDGGVYYPSHYRNYQVIDLTQMFGSTIADYIYSLEQSTAGAGVAFFRSLFPEDYYAYNAGELMSVKTTAHVIRDANNTVIGNYALDSDLELRGIPKLDANNNLYYDGDIYESSGKVTRKYGIVDLGDLYWSEGFGGFYTNALASVIKMPLRTVIPNIIMLKYQTCEYSQMSDKTVSVVYVEEGYPYNGYVAIRDSSYPDAPAFKTAMSGVYLVYELATPTTETADAFTNPQVSDQYGTEEYLDSRTIPIPVGHETYQANICPIDGVSEVHYAHSGANLWDEEWELGIYAWNGNKANSSTKIRCKNFIPCKPLTTYYLTTPNRLQLFYYDSNKSFLSFNPSSLKNVAFTTPDNCYYITFFVYEDNYGTTYNHDISINYSSTALIQLGDTYYGGEVIIDKDGKRKIKLTWGKKLLSSKDFNWRYDSTSFGYSLFYSNNNLAFVSTDTTRLKWLSELFKGTTKARNQLLDSEIGMWNLTTNSNQIAIRCDGITNLDDFINTIQDYYLYYKLSDPITIDLPDGAVIKSIPAVNNIFCDTGDTTVKFRKIGE